MSIWRVGRTLGRTLYRDEIFVGTVDTPEIAASIVTAMNVADAQRVPADKACRRCGSYTTGGSGFCSYKCAR